MDSQKEFSEYKNIAMYTKREYGGKIHAITTHILFKLKKGDKMFRLIKKYYFKIYHLFKLLGVFIFFIVFIPNVKAECNNLIDGKLFWAHPYAATIILGDNTGNNSWITPIEGNPTYTFYIDNGEKPLKDFFDELGLNIKLSLTYQEISKTNCDLTLNKCTYTLTYTGDTQFLYFNSFPKADRFTIRDKLNENINRFHLVEGNDICSNEETPTPEPGDNVFYNFLTLYTDKIEYLTNGSTKNPYLLAMIGIIFSFIVLELFLQILHLRGGKPK